MGSNCLPVTPAKAGVQSLSQTPRNAAIGSIIARMACPGSQRTTRRWLGQRSALGELLGVDFATMASRYLVVSRERARRFECARNELFLVGDDDRGMVLADLLHGFRKAVPGVRAWYGVHLVPLLLHLYR